MRQAVELLTPMKLACASGAFHRKIESGELTQLEFLDLCARELACDGVVLDVRHFPRTDDDYLAQIKKTAADFGLCIAALSDPRWFAAEPERMAEVIRRAVILGAPLVAGTLATETALSWHDQLDRLNDATSLAKMHNVTLALRNAPGTFASTTHDCKRAAKEADSAWLRYGPDPLRFDPASDPAVLAPHTVLLWSEIGDGDRAITAISAAFAGFRGHLAIDGVDGTASVEAVAAAILRWRAAFAITFAQT